MSNTINPIKDRQKSAAFTRRCGYAKKIILFAVLAMCIMAMAGMTVFAAPAAPTGQINTTDFIDKTVTVLQSVIFLIGAGIGIWGVVNLIEGYGNDNAGAKSQGMKQLMAGLGLILLGLVVIPVLKTMMNSAMGN